VGEQSALGPAGADQGLHAGWWVCLLGWAGGIPPAGLPFTRGRPPLCAPPPRQGVHPATSSPAGSFKDDTIAAAIKTYNQAAVVRRAA
jgi:hypothetical protein